MKIFITGGAGYCGSVLVPDLLNEGHSVTVYDTFWFGENTLKNHANLTRVKGDIRDVQKLKNHIPGHEVILHLAAIANDASFELDEKLSTSINFDSFAPLVAIAKSSGIRRFIYASSSSVYGVSDAPNVTEDHPLVPLTLYNKFKGLCEPILLEQTNGDFFGVVFRPATVCGYSPRQRLDLTVNILSNHAYNEERIRVFGGSQKRPNLHVRDYSRVCRTLINAEDNKIANQIFNVGSQNLTLDEIADLARFLVSNFKNVPKDNISIEHVPTDDIRSYHIDSSKISKVLNFQPQYTVEDAIKDLCIAFSNELLSQNLNNNIYYNVKLMKELKVV